MIPEANQQLKSPLRALKFRQVAKNLINQQSQGGKVVRSWNSIPATWVRLPLGYLPPKKPPSVP